MAFEITRRTTLSRADAWDAVSDLAAHAAHVPLTEVLVDDPPLRLGTRVVALTRLGPLAFADTMLVTAHDPAQRLRLVKTGRILRGWAEITVVDDPDAPGGSVVSWREELWLVALGRMTRPIGDRFGPRIFGPVVDGLLAAAGSVTARRGRST